MPYLCNMANNHVHIGLVSGFSKKSKQEKIKWISQTCFASPQLAKGILETYWHTDEKLQRLHDEFIENAVSNFYLPVAVAPNFVINEKPYVMPMVTEESSVVAASANAAKFWSIAWRISRRNYWYGENRPGALSIFGTSPKTRFEFFTDCQTKTPTRNGFA